ncbi:MAG: hypothetical protein JWR69_699 [Pedosphaera sp.]|nr:hypothetical protein [Pedosphaera sp.]
MQPRFIQSTAPKVSLVEILAGTIPRALALFFGGFTLLNLAGSLWRSNFDANLWWIDLRALPEMPATMLLLLASLCLLSFAVRPPRSVWRRLLTVSSVGLVAATALWNTLEFYQLLIHGLVRPLLPVPLSLLVFASLLVVLRAASRPARPCSPAKTSLGVLTILALCLVGFPVAQMVCFGNTDYRRPADVAVVFGARTYVDGRPSDALADRVRTACQLYRDGLVKKLIFSGGPGDGAVHETESMRRLALRLGVKSEDILTDTAGLNTQATVKNTEALFARLNAHRILVVSHFYHLPRIKLAYQRSGWDVYTVPAKESYFLRQIPYSMAREVPAMWVYYLRPLLS